MIDVTKMWFYGQSGWVLRGTANGLTYLWTGGSWSTGETLPKLYESEADAELEIQLATNYAMGS